VEAVARNLKSGPSYIAVAQDQLPKTAHDVNNFLVDCFLVPRAGGAAAAPPLINVTV
jgi:hypothetical protein